MQDSHKRRQQLPLQSYLERLRDRGLIRAVDCDEVASMFLWLVSQDMVMAVSAGTRTAPSDRQVDAKGRRIAALFAKGLAAGGETK